MVPTRTLSRFIFSEERKHKGATGELSDLLASITLGAKLISQLISTAGFKGLFGYTGKTNVQGERTQILDEQADEILIELLESSGHFGLLVSEERDSVVTSEIGLNSAKYVIAFDPLDGSSNLGSSIPVGTIFSILRKREQHGAAKLEDFLQPGRELVAAGYMVYGARTSFVYSSGTGVHGFTLDPQIGEFVLTDENIRTPERGSTYSTNEGNTSKWYPDVAEYINQMKTDNSDRKTPYSARYSGSLVADFDRNLKRGGVFLYPSDTKNPRGKLRLLYECVPLSYIAEQAGGMAIDGEKNVLDIVPQHIHERCPLIIGSKYEVDWYRTVREAV